MSLFDDIRQMKASYHQLGPRRFWTWTIGGIISAFAWVGLYAWLMMQAHWPAGCDYSGRRLIGMVKQLYCSPGLLDGDATDIGLFFCLWSIPALIGGLIVYALVKKRAQNTISNSVHSE